MDIISYNKASKNEKDIQDLKNEIIDMESITVNEHIEGADVPLHTKNGYINAVTGEFVSTNAGRATAMIQLNGTKSNYIEGLAFLYNDYGVAFYDEGKEFISGISGNDGTSKIAPQKFAATAPANARYVRWSLSDVEETDIPEDFEVTIRCEYGENKTYIVNYAYDEVQIGTKNGYIDASDGTILTSNAGRCSDFFMIPSNIGGRVIGKAFISSTFGVAFYDASKQFLSGYKDAQASGYVTDFNIQIPETAKYMRWSQVYETDRSLERFAVSFIVPVQDHIVDMSQRANVIDNYVLNATNGEIESTSSWATTELINVTSAKRFSIQATLYHEMGIAFYDAQGSFVKGISGYTKGRTSQLKGITVREYVPDGVCYIRSTIYKNGNYSVPSDFCPLLIDVDKETEKIIDYVDNSKGNSAHNILILGDSYSKQHLWVDGMKSNLNVSEIVNLGVTGATIKDQYADRSQYPYTDRPTSSGTGNQNTLSSQVEKLKRLITGTDLDEGEEKIYENHTPDIVIIEGGMNDSPDNSTKENSYAQAFIVQVSNVYYKNSSGVITQGTYHIKPDDESVDRTSFAGAYRHIVEEVLTLFPDTQIFITTASRFNYFVDNPQGYDTIAAQQIKCARYCAATVIDWNGEGNISTITDCPSGSGTQGDPYTVYEGTPNTSDGLHPNARGGRTYGRLAANVIKQRFVNIGKQG